MISLPQDILFESQFLNVTPIPTMIHKVNAVSFQEKEREKEGIPPPNKYTGIWTVSEIQYLIKKHVVSCLVKASVLSS